MRRATAFIVFLTAGLPGATWGGFSSSSRGTTTATFLALGAGARAAGMAGAQSAAPGGAASVYWNPAAAASLGSLELELMHADWFEGANYEFAAAVAPFGEGKAVSASYQQFGVGDLTRRDDAGFDQGSFEPEDMAAGLGFAWSTDGYHWGAAAKFIRSKIVDSAETVAADLGAMSPEINGRRWGLAVTNLGGRVKFDSEDEDLPVVISAGGAQRFGRHTIAGDLKFPRGNQPYVALGAEGGFAMGEAMDGFGRLGYSSQSGGEPGSLAGFSVGAGLRGRWFSLDYAFAPFGDLGSLHLLSLAIRGASARQPQVD